MPLICTVYTYTSISLVLAWMFRLNCVYLPLENTENQSRQLIAWNPMEHDFFSDRNLYHVDDEDVGTMFLGYS